jgi:hypothetical protein
MAMMISNNNLCESKDMDAYVAHDVHAARSPHWIVCIEALL